MAGVDPYATFRISLQAKVSSNLPFGFQDPAFAPLNSKIFAPENVSQLAIWDSQANPTAAITAWVTPVQGAATGLNITSEGLKDIINKVVDERTKAFMAPFNHIWTESIVSTQEDKGFRKTLIHDNGLKRRGKYIECQMTRYECPPELMRAAHLLPRRAVVWSEFFGLKAGDISTARNGMMVCIPIERAFDTKRVCFIWNNQDYIFQVLDPSLKNEKIFKGEALTFGNLHDRPLYTPGPKPFKRILSTHAQVSIKDAVALNWMSAVDAQRYDVYHNLSRGSTDDDLWVDRLTNFINNR